MMSGHHGMTFDLTKPVSLSAADDQRMQTNVTAQLMQDGASAFALGWPITKCPPFKHPDHAWAWRQGWRNKACGEPKVKA